MAHAQAFHDAGWTRQEVINLPNALSMGRLLSGPVVAHLILQHQWPAAMITLAIAGISDWADGYAAKHWGQSSVLGSYLDPLADKVLVGCTVGALAAEVCHAPPLRLCSEVNCCPGDFSLVTVYLHMHGMGASCFHCSKFPMVGTCII